NAAGTRAYTASISHSDILDTTDPRSPVLISTIHDPAINIHHDAQATPDGRTLIIGDELAGAAAGPQCPGGGLHFYDITDEASPQKTGVFFAHVTRSLTNLCTAHVFRIEPDGKSLVIGWYNGGTRVVDISDPTGIGPAEIGYMVPSGLGGNAAVANSWASKQYKGYIYSNDRARGLDIMQWRPPDEPVEGSQGVLAVVDTGINPYHQVFRWDDPQAYEHPSTYIPGYPEDAVSLPITLDEPNLAAAVQKDCDLWKSVQTGKLYWFPGTKIVGGVSFDAGGSHGSCSSAQILDSGGHGTMTASRATATEYGACKECYVVAVQFPTSIPIITPGSSTQPAVNAITWAADNASWIDGQTNSWGPFAPAWDPTGAAGLLTANPQLVRAVEEVSSTHAAFWASGNGAAFRGGVAGHPTLLAPHMTPSALMVGGMDSGYINTWPGFPPHVVSDSCDSWAAHHTSTTTSAENVGGGTSGATPFAAGGAVRILMEARRILGDQETGVGTSGVVAQAAPGVETPASGPLTDGQLTLQEWKDVTFKTASSRPVREFEDGSVCDQPLDAPYNTTPVKWASVHRQVPAFLYLGYGAVDRGSMQQAFRVLRGQEDMPDRTVEDAYFAADRQARTVTYEVWSRP
ncbi:MAG TPA: S8 family serine peptidase, partial [Actinomycetota bacterium]